MPTLDQMLHPRCPNHGDLVIERFGVCTVCLMSSHRHLSGFKLIPDPPEKQWGNPWGRWVREDVDHDARERPPMYWEPRDDD